MSQSQQTDLNTLIKRRHPLYGTTIDHWDFLEECYEGGREWFHEKNIFRYMKEGEQEFEARLKRAYRFNHTREVVDLVNKYLFRAEVHRPEDGAPDGLKKFWSKSTRSGLDIDEFMQIVSTKSSIFGRPWVIVDSDYKVHAQSTKRDMERFNGPYAYVVRPQDVLDMSYDESGNLNWILIREFSRDDGDPYTASGKVKPRFRLWTKTGWTLIEKGANGKLLKAGEASHDLGIVPAVPADNSFCSDPYVTPALIADIAYLDRACANYASNLDAIIQDQTFSQLAMPAQNVMPGEDAYAKIQEMGTRRVFLYDGENGNQPMYLSPDPKQAQLLINAIQQLINEIYHSVGLAGERTKQDNAKGIDNSSGVAKYKDFERVTALLKSKANCLETAENQIAKIVCLWNGDEYPKDLVAYSEDFDVRSLEDEVAVMMSVISMDSPESVVLEQMKVVIQKLLPNLSEFQLEKVFEEAKEWAKDRKENFGLKDTFGAQSADGSRSARRKRNRAGQKQSATKRQETVAN